MRSSVDSASIELFVNIGAMGDFIVEIISIIVIFS